ncbi:hypothetical protein [Hellea balneolensis]|uniref:hypothetical protein n=1 Tax=Hellea balneolensis TaxID=287478 RepID=UPI000412F84D|nr:hypothetical protein [Hellea balneolensis]
MHGAIRHFIIGVFTATGLAATFAAQAQSVAPMKQKVVSFSDKFMVQFEIRNTYATPQVNMISIYTPDWKPVKASYVSKKAVKLASNDTLVITAIVPFSEQNDGSVNSRMVYVCNSIIPKVDGVGSAFKGEVCGKVFATKLQEQ